MTYRIVWAMTLVGTTLFSLSFGAARADDWPQWLGPRRDGVWRETGILRKFPVGGPKVLWRTPVSGGYAGPAVAGDRVVVTDFLATGDKSNDPGKRSDLTGKERVHCLDAATGKVLWTHEYPCTYRISYPAGPRATPTIQGGQVFTLGAEGDLRCLDLKTGKLIWERNLPKEFGAETPIWGYVGHPLVDGQKVITISGGAGSVAVALNKDTGATLWRALDNKEQGYCPPSIIEAGGKRQLLIWHPKSLNGLDPETGKVYWSVDLAPLYGMSIQAPVRHGDLLFTGGIGDTAVTLKLSRTKPEVEEVWRGVKQTAVYPTCAAPQVDDQGILYGACQQGHFRAVNLATGERLWETFKPTTGQRFASSGTCFIVRNGDRYFLMSENGDLIIARLSAAGYEELDRAHIVEATNEAFGRSVVWSHPAFARRALFMRNDKEIVCVSLAE